MKRIESLGSSIDISWEGWNPREINLTRNALTVIKKRYLKKNENGELIEKPEQMFRRVAENIASVDRIYDKNTDTIETAKYFYNLI